MIAGLVLVALAFVGAIFAVRWWIVRLEDRQPTVENDSGFAMWSQDAPGVRHAQEYGVRRKRETVAYSDNASNWDDDPDDISSRTGIGLAAVASDWERDDPRNAPELGFSDASDMGVFDSSTETDSSSSDTGDSSDSSLDDSDFSDSSDMGGLDN